MKFYISFCLLLVVVVGAMANPKKYYEDESNFQPSPSNNRYYEYNIANSAKANDSKPVESKESKATSDHLRFGLPAITATYGNTGNGVSYGNTNGYMINPVKIDIGGIALGALLGLGAILFIPKLAHVFSGAGYRSIENEMSTTFSDVLSRVDTTLEQNNIDSTACMQRIICNYVTDVQKNMQNGEANTVDQVLFTLSNNSLVTSLLDGSSVKQAVDLGKIGNPDKCSAIFDKCPINKENVMKIITNLLPA